MYLFLISIDKKCIGKTLEIYSLSGEAFLIFECHRESGNTCRQKSF